MKILTIFRFLIVVHFFRLHIFMDNMMELWGMVVTDNKIINNRIVCHIGEDEATCEGTMTSQTPMNISDAAYINPDLAIFASHNEIRLGSLTHGRWRFIKLILRLDEISKIRYDHIHQNIYFIERIIDIIGAVPYGEYKNKDITQFKAIVTPSRPIIDFVVEYFKNYIFWIDKKDYTMIHRADLRGQRKKDLIYQGLIEPISMEVDSYNERIVWYDARKRSIETASYEGKNRIIIHQNDIVYKGLKLINNDTLLIFNDTSINVLSSSGLSKIEIKDLKGNISSLAIYPNESLTERCNLECMQFCFSENKKFFCDCYPWYTLFDDQKDCITPKDYLHKGIAAILNGKICFLLLSEFDKPLNHITFWEGTDHSTELTIDDTSREVFFIQYINGGWHVKKRERRYTKIYDLYQSKERLRGLAHYSKTKALFFGKGRVIMKLVDGKRTIIVEEDKDIFLLAIDMEQRMLAWVTSDNNAIYVSSLDGSNKELFVASVEIKSLKIFPGRKRIVWASNNAVYSIDYEQSSRVERKVKGIIQDVALFKDVLTWTSTSSHVSTICSGSYNDKNIPETCLSISGNISSMSIFDELIQSNLETDQCAVDNGGCSDVCLPNANATCSCLFGKVLNDDKKGCTQKNVSSLIGYLADASTNTVYKFSENLDFAFAFHSEEYIHHIDVNSKNGHLLVFQSNSKNESLISITNADQIRFNDLEVEIGCFDILTERIYFVAKTQDGARMFAYIINGIIIVISRTVSKVTDIICWTSKRIVILATIDSRITKFAHETNDLDRIDTNFRSTNARLAYFSKDHGFFALDKESSEIFEVNLRSKKAVLIFHEEKDISDFGVGEAFLYVLHQRKIIIVMKNSGEIQKTITVSPEIGKPSYILIHRHKIGQQEENQEEENEKDSSSMVLAIALSTSGVLIVVIIVVIVIWARKSDFGGFWRNRS